MALRQDRDRAKTQQEKLQAILSAMLKDEDNKYCEDCDAKGPRWASWNLGIFLCIRCAGIHRNLGVHISRVKSVNLDSWTAEQVAMMQEMGNSRARAVYEANVPDDFQRPQSNSTIEIFIRAKYEAKKYIAREWVPPKPAVPKEWIEEDVTEKKRPRSKPSSSASPSNVNQQNTVSSTRSIERRGSAARPAAVRASDPKPAPAQPIKASSGASDLLGLNFSVNETSNTEIPPAAGTGGQGGDLLLDLFGASSSASLAQGTQPSTVPPQQNGFAEPNLFEKGSGGGGGSSDSSGSGEQAEKKSTKDSIMALFGNGRMQPQVFGVPGVATMSRPLDGKGRASTSSGWTSNPFLYPEANFYQACYVASSPYYYPSAGGVYLPQQQMYGSGGMQPPIMQQQQGMMGMQPGMMGQPVQQGMMGMPQPAGAMYGGQMCGSMMVSGPGFMQPQVSQPAVAQQFNPMQQPVSTPAMAPPLNAMQQPVSQPAMALQLNAMPPPVSQPVAQQLSAMQPPVSQPAMPRQQHYPMPQQMHFQQMQQQMANMTLGGSSMAGMHQPQPTAVGGRSWGGAATGHTLSSSLWQ